MNPADSNPDPVQQALTSQAAAIQRHEDQLSSVSEGLQEFAARQDRNLNTIREQLNQLFLSARPTAPEARLPPPERYSGEPGTCRPFLTQCSLLFELQPSSYPSERARVAFIISQLTGRARDWGTAEWERQSGICSSVKLFSDELKKVFDHVTPGREAARGLLSLVQGGRSVADYSIEFRTIAAESKWNADSLFDAFYHGLSDVIKDELAARDPPVDLDALIALAIRVDGRLRERKKEKAQPAILRGPPRMPAAVPVSALPFPSNASGDPTEPMQLGRTHLSLAERQRRLRDNRCLYCGQIGHFLASCPVKGQAHQ